MGGYCNNLAQTQAPGVVAGERGAEAAPVLPGRAASPECPCCAGSVVAPVLKELPSTQPSPNNAGDGFHSPRSAGRRRRGRTKTEKECESTTRCCLAVGDRMAVMFSACKGPASLPSLSVTSERTVTSTELKPRPQATLQASSRHGRDSACWPRPGL